MPIYGEAKRRDMARSVLPSTSRKSSREYKRIVHHQVRTHIRGVLVKGDWENEPDLLLDPQRNKSYQGIKVVVRERRGADKVAPLMRWAEANADKLGSTPQERYAMLRSMLPPNIIGWHAMTHVEMIDEFAVSPRWWRRYQAEEISDEEKYRRKQEKYLQLYEALYKVCTGRRLQKRFNKVLRDNWRTGHEAGGHWDFTLKRHVRGDTKYCPNCGLGARPLLGVGDIPLFIAEWHSNSVQNRFKWKHLGQGVLVGEEPEVRAFSIGNHGNCWGNALLFLKDEGLLDRSYNSGYPYR